MEGTIEKSGTEYWWWAGPANDGAKEGFCVHCRDAQFGVTQYIDKDPDTAAAEKIATALIAKVASLS